MRGTQAHVTSYCRENDMTGVDHETFTITEEGSGEMVTIDLKPGGAGISVTEENKEEYVNLMVEYRISKRVKDQFDALMSGFGELIPQDLITAFNERELEWLIGGISEIDVYAFSVLFSLSPIGVVLRFDGRDDWAKFTEYRGYEANDEVIQWFWKCVRSWPSERQSRLLQFVTGTIRIPVNGFKDLQGPVGRRRFTIEKAGDPDELPKRRTPFNCIDLPPYKEYASLENKLTLAIECVSLSHVFRGYQPLITAPTERAVSFERVQYCLDGRNCPSFRSVHGCPIISYRSLTRHYFVLYRYIEHRMVLNSAISILLQERKWSPRVNA